MRPRFRNMLRYLVLTPVIAAAAALVTTPAMAAASFNVPFNFTVGGKACPAGHYQLDRDVFHNLMTLTSKDGKESFTWLAQPNDAKPTDTRAVLRFEGQNQQYVLSAVRYGVVKSPNLNKTHRLEHYQMASIQAE